MEFECDRYLGYVAFPAKFVHRQFGINSPIYFCVDTGTLRSILCYDLAKDFGVPLEQLSKSPHPLRVAGVTSESYILEGSELLIREFAGRLHTVPLSPMLVQGKPESPIALLPVPSLLGMDFISCYTFVIENLDHGGRVYFTDQKVKNY